LAQIDEFGLVSIKAFALDDLIHLDLLLNHCAGNATTYYELDANFEFSSHSKSKYPINLYFLAISSHIG